jgi:hypothetical protein
MERLDTGTCVHCIHVFDLNKLKSESSSSYDWTIKKKGVNRIGRSINHIISLKICKERSDWIILPKLINQNNSIIRTLR